MFKNTKIDNNNVRGKSAARAPRTRQGRRTLVTFTAGKPPNTAASSHSGRPIRPPQHAYLHTSNRAIQTCRQIARQEPKLFYTNSRGEPQPMDLHHMQNQQTTKTTTTTTTTLIIYIYIYICIYMVKVGPWWWPRTFQMPLTTPKTSIPLPPTQPLLCYPLYAEINPNFWFSNLYRHNKILFTKELRSWESRAANPCT